MKRLIIVSFLAACLSAHADQTTQTSKSDHSKVMRLTQMLEERRLDPAAPEARAWLIRWAEAAPDVSILVCDILGPIPGTQVPYGPELLGQFMFGNGAFQLQDPRSKNDVQKTQMAGVASLLAAYRSIVEADPSAHIPHFDAWLDKQVSGTLDAELAPVIQDKCTSSAP